MNGKLFKINLVGDVMLGRLIDQLFPTHVHEPREAKISESFKHGNAHLSDYNRETPWGNTLRLLKEADLNIINLETSVTTHDGKWPDKVFNYRMHPVNINALQAARIDHASLANNHTLDFQVEGLHETMQTLKDAGISFAGVGHSAEEARSSAILQLPRDGKPSESHLIELYSASDHPSDWGSVPGFHLIDYSEATYTRLRKALSKERTKSNTAPPASLQIFSIHWGPNYSWKPDQEIQDLAHFLIDECGVDIIHGHSSHHVQGVEKYHGKLIIYGCGDFVDDYALTPEYRNDLSALWRVTVEEKGSGKLELAQLEVFPTRINRFQAEALEPSSADHEWVMDKVTNLSQSHFGTNGFKRMPGGELALSLAT